MLPLKETINIVRGLIRDKRFNEAESVLLESMRIDDANLVIVGMLADLYIKMERLDDAEIHVESILRSEPGNSYALQKKGDILAKRGKYNDALDIFIDLHRRGDNSYFLIKRIARVYFLMNNLQDSLEYANKAKKKHPDKADLYYLLFQIYEKGGDTKKAMDAIDSALEIEPGNSFYYSRKLSLRMNEKNLDSSSIKEILEISGDDNPHLLKLHGDKLKKEGHLDAAIDAYKRLISIDDNEFNQKSLAFLYYKKKDYSSAFKIFINLSDSQFLDMIFISTITASAKENNEKSELVDRMVLLAKGSDRFRNLWGKIKKLSKELEDEEDQ